MKVVSIENGKQKAIESEALKEYLNFDYLYKNLTGFSIEEIKEIPAESLQNIKSVFCNEKGNEDYFILDENDTNSENNDATVVVTNDGLRLKRAIKNYINFAWFKPSEDDCTEQFETACMVAYSKNLPLYLPQLGFTYKIRRRQLILCSIIGESSDVTFELISSVGWNNWTPIIQPYMDDIKLFNFTVDGRNDLFKFTSTTGVLGIGAYHLKGLSIENINIRNTRHIGLNISSCPKFSIKGVVVKNCGRYGQDMPIAQADRIGVLLDNDVNVDNELFAGADCTVERLEVYDAGLDGIVTGIGCTYKKCITNNNGVEYSQNAVGAGGFYFRPPQSIENLTVINLVLDECIANNNTGHGIDIGNNAGQTQKLVGLTVVNCTANQNGLCGIALSGNDINCTLCTTKNNGQNTFTTFRKCGISIDGIPNAPTSNVSVFNNTATDTQQIKTQLSGVYIGNYGDVSNVDIRDNDFSGNVNDSIQFANNNINLVQGYLSVQRNKGLVATYVNNLPNNSNLSIVSDYMKLAPTNDITIQSFSDSVEQCYCTIHNISQKNITISNNQIKCVGDTDLVITPNVKARFRFEQGKWVQEVDMQNTSFLSKVSKITGITLKSFFRDLTANDSILDAFGYLNTGYKQSTSLRMRSNTGSNVTTEYLKICTVNFGQNNYNDIVLLLDIYTYVPASYIRLYVNIRQQTSSIPSEVHLEVMQKGQSNVPYSSQDLVFQDTDFYILHEGYGGDYSLYVKKNTSYTTVFVYEAGRSYYQASSSVVYNNGANWINTLPASTFKVQSQSKKGTFSIDPATGVAQVNNKFVKSNSVIILSVEGGTITKIPQIIAKAPQLYFTVSTAVGDNAQFSYEIR